MLYGTIINQLGWLLRYLFCLLLLFAISGLAHASAWMLSEKEVIYGSGITYYTDREYWNQASQRIRSNCRSHNAYLYQGLEYGYSYYTTLLLSTTFALQHCGADRTNGLGDVRLGIRGRLNLERNGQTWELVAIVPTGYSNTAPRRIGNGRFGIEGGLFASGQGQGFEEKRRSFLDGSLRLRHWFGAPASQVLGDIGWVNQLAPRHRVTMRINGVFSLHNSTPETITLTNQTRLSDFDRVYISGGYDYRISEHWSSTLSVGRDLWGRNTGVGTFVSLYISHAWSL